MLERSSTSLTTTRWGWALSILVTVAMIANGLFSIFGEWFAPDALAQMMQAGGFALDTAHPIGLIMLVCAVVYIIPRTAMLGAILMTGFVGGAICTEYRIGLVFSSSQMTNFLLGVLPWVGLYLRDARVRALIPFRSDSRE